MDMVYHGGMALRSPILALTLLAAAGCGTVRFEYEADIDVDDGREGTLFYERSYDAGGHQVACAITAIFYGGWCWAYLAMPTDEQEARLRRDAEDYAAEKAKEDVSLRYGRARRVSYEDERVRARLKLTGEKKSEEKAANKPKTITREDPDEDDAAEDGYEGRSRKVERPLRESGIKILFPAVIGIGIAAEMVDPDTFSCELGTGAMLGTSYTGIYGALKGAVHKEKKYDIRAGLVHLRYADRGGDLPLNGLVLEYATRGLGFEYMHLPRRRPFGCIDDCGSDQRPEGILQLTYRP